MALRELLAKFGIEVDTAPLDKADASASSFAEKLSGLGDALTGSALVGGILSFVDGMIQAGDALKGQSDALGIGVEELQAWQFTAEQTGASAEGLASGVKILYKNLAAASEGGEAAANFSKLGIKIKDATGQARSAIDVIPDLADKIADAKTPTEQAGLALKFFGKNGLALLPMLKEGADGTKELLERFRDLGGGYSKEFVDAADDAADAQAELNTVWKSAKSQIGVVLLPYIVKGTKALTDMAVSVLRAFKGTSGFKSLLVSFGGAGALTAITSLAGAASKLGLLGGAATKAGPGLLGVAKNLGAVAGALVRTVLPMVVLYLLVDDIITLFDGGDSAIGRFIDGIWGVGTTAVVVETLKLGWQDFLSWVTLLGPVMSSVWEFVKTVLQDAFNGFKGTTELFRAAWAKLTVDMRRYWDEMVEGASEGIDRLMQEAANRIQSDPVLRLLFGSSGFLLKIRAESNIKDREDDKQYLERRQLALRAQAAVNEANGVVNQTIQIDVESPEPAAAATEMQAKLQGATDKGKRALGALKRP